MHSIPSPLSGVRSPWGGSRAPDLASLFLPGNVGILFEPQVRNTMWQDAAGVTPVSTYGQGVMRWGDRSGGGRNATQASAASALIYGRHPAGGTRNLATYTEALGNAVWTNVQGVSTVTPAAFTSSTGVVFEKVVPAATTLVHGRRQNSAAFVVGSVYTVRELVKRAEAGINFEMFAFTGVGHSAVFNLTTGVVSATSGSTATISGPDADGIFDCRMTFTANSTITNNVDLRLTRATVKDQTFVGDGTTGLLMAQHQRERSATFTGYQKVTTAYDVAEAGKADCLYLLCDGADNSAATPEFAWGSDKAYLCAAVRKNSDVAAGMIAEFSPTIAANNGAFALQAPASAAANYTFSAKGSIASDASYTNAAVAAPNAAVIECIADIAADRCELWIDGVLVGTSSADQGAGAFGTFALNIGRRNNATLPFNGLLYGLMGLNRLPSDAERATARRLMAAKQGRTL